MLYCYKFNQGADKPHITTYEEICPEGFISFGDECVDWTKFTYDRSKLVDIPVEPTPQPTIDELAIAIEIKYQPQLDSCLNLILTAMGADGSNQSSKVVSLQLKYKEINDNKNTEVEALYL